MTTLNPDGEITVAALLALLDAASAIIQLPPDVRRQTIGIKTIQHLLEDVKALDRILTDDLHGKVQPQRHEEQQEPHASLRDLRAFAAENSPTAQSAPKRREKPARPPKIPALPRTHVLPPVFPATTNGNGNGHAVAANGPQRRDTEPEPSHGKPGDAPADANDPPHTSNRLPFAEFDRLCRAEMKRLSMDGRLPGHKLWNSERNPQLPTMAAVLWRYKAAALVDLATILGLEPPLSAAKESKP